MALEPGTICLLDFGEPGPTWHQRLVLGHTGALLHLVCTPDYDIYEEELGENNAELVGFRICVNGAPPVGIQAIHIYGFAAMTAAQRADLLAEGLMRTNVLRFRNGLGPLPAAGALVAAGPPLGAAAAAAVAPAAGGSASTATACRCSTLRLSRTGPSRALARSCGASSTASTTGAR